MTSWRRFRVLYSEQQQIAEQKQVAFDAESAKLATIQEEQPEKKSASSVIKAVIAKAKGLLGCINFEKREKPAKTEELKEEQTEEPKVVVEEPKVESVAPTLPPMSAPAPAVAPVTPVAAAAPPADI